jgi:enoyl-CoA hydratase
MAENVTLTREGPIATLTLNRPDRRNSLSDPLLTDLGAALVELRDDESTRVVVLTGAPPVFCAGADAGFRKGMSEDERREAFANRRSQFRRLFERANTLLEGLEQVTIAMINGHAVGGGWGLTLACDFRFASLEAQFWLPEVDLGVLLGVGSTARLVRLVGPAITKELVLEGRRYTADELKALNLINRVYPAYALADAVKEHAELLAKKPHRPLSEMKARINTIARTGIPEVNAMTEGFLERA